MLCRPSKHTHPTQRTRCCLCESGEEGGGRWGREVQEHCSADKLMQQSRLSQQQHTPSLARNLHQLRSRFPTAQEPPPRHHIGPEDQPRSDTSARRRQRWYTGGLSSACCWWWMGVGGGVDWRCGLQLATGSVHPTPAGAERNSISF